MPTDVIMPQMGESIFEGTITKWLKKAGDAVEKDEPLFEISTDKVDAEIPSPVAGVLSEIRIAEGATVEVNTVVAVIGSSAEQEKLSVPADLAQPQAPVTDPGTDVVMPQLGESIFEGTITKWLKNLGDRVEKDEPLFEVSSDKVDAEIPAPEAGILTQIKVPEGTTVEINTVVAVIGGSASQAASVTSPLTPNATAVSEPLAAPAAISADPNRRIRSSPLVRRIAKENNINLAQVAGTGADGRINKEDILRHMADPAARSRAFAAKPQLAAPQVPQTVPGQPVAMSKMRAIIAQRMVESMQIAPHVHTVYKIDMTRIVNLRERERVRFDKAHGVKLSYMPFIAAAAIEALRRFPIVNASLIDGMIHYHSNINLGIAVALEWGLIVPVVRQAETRSFVDIARTIADLAERARSKKLSPDEVGGSTFTLTNSGVFGDEFGTPIINQPESAILAIGSLKKEPAVLTDAEGNDSIAIRGMQHYCLGFDHRTIDGADAGKFMSVIKRTLENWDREIG